MIRTFYASLTFNRSIPTNCRRERYPKRMHTTFIALGGNLPSWAGEPEATLAAAVQRLESLGQITSRSSLYSTEPVGLADQPRFMNAVVELQTGLEPLALLHRLLDLETEFGRDRSAGIANGPRTLDLDLLLYQEKILDEPELQLPHPRLAERAFVLVPWAEIAPQVRDPRSGKTAAELLQALLDKFPDDALAVQQFRCEVWG